MIITSYLHMPHVYKSNGSTQTVDTYIIRCGILCSTSLWRVFFSNFNLVFELYYFSQKNAISPIKLKVQRA